jgi:hypothetical protein
MKKLLLAALLAASFGAAHAGPNLVVDGSFEDQAQGAGSWSVYNTINGWTTVGGSGIELRNNVAGAAFDGVNFVELDSYNNSAMAQTLTTVAGASYDLSFAYSARTGVAAASNLVEVLWNGISVASITADGSGLSGNDWHVFSYAVTGTGSDTLVFRAGGTNDSLGGSLDAVGITAAVPEPSTYAMMFLGLGLIGASLSRRRKMR